MRVYLRVKGRVQGVGFRYFVITRAHEHSLTGWVKNCSNGDVECEAQGEEKSLKKFVTLINHGNGLSRVDQVLEERLPDVAGEKSFEITY